MKIALGGAGVIGTSLGVLLQRAGHTIVAVASRTKRRAQAAAARAPLLAGLEILNVEPWPFARLGRVHQHP